MFIRVGQIVGAFGIRGQLKVRLLTDFPERFEPGRRLRLNGDWVTIADASDHSGQLTLTLEGITDRSQAEALQWAYLEALEDERPELHEDEFLTQDLIGLNAITEAGEELGTVARVERYPAHDVLVIGKVMVPAVAQFVVKVDLDAKQIVLRPIPGMFDEED